ncbi:uncharacterized protein N0V89_008935 [Didymosphaeria variabile]|uniref:NAD(P)-binding protein n=1 Tax=Didymosphaeria variabile TaxID=1932322 RepID=A0A9W9C921_9PLEO|nr:uncharacterized protein N0V89_008935 [Didymosphaeria variabile]KAJ4350314.1 hypothetical protein N0V89_008935 [Didymosphaeria variabile]
MDPSKMKAAFMELMETDFTPTVHTSVYPAISPTRPELSQSGRVVLITGGGSGVGKAIAENFVLASASHVAIVGRRLEVLQATAAELKNSAAAAGSSCEMLTYQGDITSKSDVNSIFDDLASKRLAVDVLVMNAAKIGDFTPLMELGMDELWTFIETNVKAPMILAERFLKQNPKKKKASDLPGAFAVWAASEEAAFVHNRIVWAAWDVEEWARGDVRKLIEEDDNYLRIGVGGFALGKRAKGH